MCNIRQPQNSQDDSFDSLSSLVIRGFKFAVGPECRIWLVMEEAVGERTADALVEEQEQER